MEVAVVAAEEHDVAQRTTHVAPDVADRLGVDTGDAVAVRGDDETVLTVRVREDVPGGRLAVTTVDQGNAGVQAGATATVEPVAVPDAARVTLRATDNTSVEVSGGSRAVRRLVDGHPVTPGDTVSVSALGDSVAVPFLVDGTVPDGPVRVGEATDLVTASAAGVPAVPRVTRDDLGGVDEEFERLSRRLLRPLERTDAGGLSGGAGGVLLSGPSGVGKTSLAAALGAATDATFCPVVPGGEYHDGRVDVEAVGQVAADGPTLVFLDDLSVLASADDDAAAPLARLVDELCDRENVSVLGATDDPEAVSPAVRRGGRLADRVEFGPPGREARREVVAVHTADIPLADVSPGWIADRTPGFVAADLERVVEVAVGNALDRRGGESAADIAVRAADVKAALETVVPGDLGEFAVDRPSVGYDDIGGLREVKREVVRAVEWPLRYPDLLDRVHSEPPAGLLLYGPPGTGKTMLAKAVAASSDANFIGVDGPELFDRYVGESERAVRDVFDRARRTAPTVVFFDEVDALAARRDTDEETGVSDRVVSQLLTELDGLEPRTGVVVIGATNRPDRLDPALLRPGRFEKALEVPLPDREAREEVFAVHLADVPVAGDIDVGRLAAATEGYSGSDIAAVVREAGLLAVEGALTDADFDADAAARGLSVSQQHLREAIEVVDRSVSEEMREAFDAHASNLRR